VNDSLRTGLVKALRAATAFDVPEELLTSCFTATPDLVQEPERLAAIEADVRRLVLRGIPVHPGRRAAVRPVLGNIAEAVVESLLVEAGWTPLGHDAHGMSFGHGVDLLMFDPMLERVVATEVKSTVQPSRWPRLARGRTRQLTPDWLDHDANTGMRGLDVGSSDIYVMVVQLHFTRRRWRACVGHTAEAPHSIVSTDQLLDLNWVDS
jgi:hypothetical protein